MKTIEISNKTFGELWSRATEDDKSEEDILQRLLHEERPLIEVHHPPIYKTEERPGFVDLRYGVRFPQGFRVFRTYKGRNYRATASNGQWNLEGDVQPYNSLGELSTAIGAKTENAWLGWRFSNDDGTVHLIDELRPKAAIKRRKVKTEETQ